MTLCVKRQCASSIRRAGVFAHDVIGDGPQRVHPTIPLRRREGVLP